MVKIEIDVSEEMAFIIKNHVKVTSDDLDWIESAILQSLKDWNDLGKDATLQDVFDYYNINKYSYCSECREWLPTSKEFERHLLNHK